MPVISSSGEPCGVLDILGLMQGTLHTSDRGMLQVRARRMHPTDFVKDSSADDIRPESALETVRESENKSETQSLVDSPVGEYNLQALLASALTGKGVLPDALTTPPNWWDVASESVVNGVNEEMSLMKTSLLTSIAASEERAARYMRMACWISPVVFAAGFLVGASFAKR